ncbi:CYFA0S30e00870g1_1 [Cyberlindnera fabianii]|uniref:CYFA0S30e00870g1_1 n=1 Tax=Cyberlindnera fabianii TaxID=36022 RepID=A0A061BH81_CYBFA|nr:CYFA0S30e00870g1_1 [Cyberlindnera fabianii]
MAILIGVDVGGTNTDSVLVDPHKVSEANKGILAWNKLVTTKDVSEGIESGITRLLKDSNVKKEHITSVTIGTTHFINAVIEQDAARLAKVAVLRLCGPYTEIIPPFIDFPPGLKSIMNGHVAYLQGGFHVDGNEIRSIDQDQLLKNIEIIKSKNIKTVAITGIFSSLKPDQELFVKDFILKHIPDARVVMSHQVSGVGYIERENATILNASIMPFAEKIIMSFINAVENKLGLKCPVFLTQNDGTVLSAYESLKLPIRTFSSGTTNSMRGASFLGNVIGKTAIVIDVGGTTADVGLLLPSGFPRQSSSYCVVGGVRMNFSMPHVESIGLGGGSLVREGNDGEILVGPESVGAEILERSLIFGGNECTASDVAVAADSSLQMGTRVDMPEEFIKKFQARVKVMLENVVDRMKTNPEEIPVLAVGGGSFIVPPNLQGASQVIRPEFYSVANAIGAALGKISSEVNCIKKTTDKDAVLEELKKEAIQKALEKGAIESTIEIVFFSCEPVPYVDGTYIFFVKTIADVDYDNIKFDAEDHPPITILENPVTKDSKVQDYVKLDDIDYENYKPFINEKRQWIISEVDLELLRIGTYILGCGGGGNPYPYFLCARNLLNQGDELVVIDVKDVPKYSTDSIGSYCSAGSPTVSNEQLKGPGLLEASAMMTKFTGRKPELVFPIEIGGGNGIGIFRVSATSKLNLPVVDCDLMGRAYPAHFQTIPVAYTKPNESYYSPTVMSNGNGNTLILSQSKDDFLIEKVLRASLAEIGCTVDVMNPLMTAEEVATRTIHGSLSLSWRIGRAVRIARQKSQVYKMPEIILESVNNTGKLLFKGKIIGVERKLFKGHSWGEVTIESSDKKHMKIPFKNENIYASIDGDVVCSVPDLISVVDADLGEAVGTQDYRYGLMVFVLAIAPSSKWTETERALSIGGPKGFGLEELEYKPISEYSAPVSVIDQYGPEFAPTGV